MSSAWPTISEHTRVLSSFAQMMQLVADIRRELTSRGPVRNHHPELDDARMYVGQALVLLEQRIDRLMRTYLEYASPLDRGDADGYAGGE